MWQFWPLGEGSAWVEDNLPEAATLPSRRRLSVSLRTTYLRLQLWPPGRGSQWDGGQHTWGSNSGLQEEVLNELTEKLPEAAILASRRRFSVSWRRSYLRLQFWPPEGGSQWADGQLTWGCNSGLQKEVLAELEDNLPEAAILASRRRFSVSRRTTYLRLQFWPPEGGSAWTERPQYSRTCLFLD